MIDLFSEPGTLDELGIGAVRDGFADRFFPGTSTIQTRVRYFLLIPWIYRSIESRYAGRPGIADKARAAEIRLIEALMASDDSAGTIGQQARWRLKRLPTDVYWQGMATWGIRASPGSREQYHRRIETLDPDARQVLRTDDGEPLDSVANDQAWHAYLPDPPDGFPRIASLRLSSGDAEYLTERILTMASDTLLAVLVKEGKPSEPVSFVWDHPQLGEFPETMREEVEHAHCFSEAIHGSALLYNLLLAERSADRDRADGYRHWLEEWSTGLEERGRELADWNRPDFWEVVARTQARVTPQTRDFIDRWLDIALTGPTAVADDDRARDLVAEREVSVKGPHARLANDRALEGWSGASGTAQLDYRWPVAQRHTGDILAGLGRSLNGDHR